MASVFPWGSQSPLLAVLLLVATLCATVLLVWMHTLARRALARLEKNGPASPLLRSPRVLGRVRRVLGWFVAAAATYAAMYASTWLYEPLLGLVFRPALENLPSVAVILITIALANIGLEAVSHVDEVVTARAAKRGRKPNRQVVHALQVSLRYAVMLMAAFVVGAGVLDLLGYQGDVGAAIIAWTTGQASAIILLAGLIGVAFVGGRLIRGITAEVRWTSDRLSPEVVDAIGGVARGALYGIVGIIAMITILSAIGLGGVGSTLVVVMSSFIGLTVAMAGTGSIGNALSGAVLVAFRPYRKGDRVIIGDDMVCDVEDVTLMFTRVRTLAGERVDMPNNGVLAKRIRNLSNSGAHAIVVKLGIGYDVSHTLVRELATAAAAETEGIVTDPPPALYAREMGNYAIEYELFAYTANPRHLKIRSDLLGHLQKRFYDANVEIMTPDIYVIRKGKTAEDEGPVRVRVSAAAEAAAPPTASEPRSP